MTDPVRYHLLHTIGGRAAQHGWWWNEEITRGKFRDCVGLYGVPGARITLDDAETGDVLTTWPEEARPSAILARTKEATPWPTGRTPTASEH